MFNPPTKSCSLCPRLVEFRCANQNKFPQFYNGPVPSFGELDAQLLIVGLAPGLKGANATGRPFTNDYAGDLLYATLLKFGFAKGHYGKTANDGLQLVNCRITNSVRCVPPENKPTPEEQKTCQPFIRAEIAAMPNLRFVLVLGLIAHNAALDTFGVKKSTYKFAHGAVHELPNGIKLYDSYHCSRYNTQTKRLTTEMFEGVVELISKNLIIADYKMRSFS
ncbi:MAG: uracil-DNA glycosylase [Alphaproteobacteria bacterium]|nr:MAG: uracil-DNA glycosylase [Alphaproteobacteria bacterium]